jgi:hypothetical protein
MYWRIGSAYRKRPREINKDAFHRIVQESPPPGLVAFDGGTAMGWCHFRRAILSATSIEPRF